MESERHVTDSLYTVTDSLLFTLKCHTCKSPSVFPVFIREYKEDTLKQLRISQRKDEPVIPKRKPLITAHGNVIYDFFYQSHADTPFVEKEIYQHNIQTVIDITIRDNYPLHLAFSTSKGNSSYFRDITGLNLKYNNIDFKNALVQRAKGWDAVKLKQLNELQVLKTDLANKWGQLNNLRGWFNDPSRLQRMVELRESILYNQKSAIKVPQYTGAKMRWPSRDLAGLDIHRPETSRRLSHKQEADTLLQQMSEEYDRQKVKLDSLQLEVSRLEGQYRKMQSAYGMRKEKLIDVLMKSRNNKELSNSLEDMELPDTILPKGYKTLLAIKSVGIGRTMVDYSELTVKNISITGFQAEYNPSYYVAVATGTVDYRFRDFVINSNRVRQYVNIVRIGAGMKDGNNIIASFYNGKKQVYNFNAVSPGGGNPEPPDYKIMGISLEGRWQLGRNSYVIGEAAKSSMPYYMRIAEHESISGSMFRFEDHSNEAYSVSAGSFIPQWGTRMTGMFKLLGGNFQSFSMYSSGSAQQAWMMKLDQPLFRQQLTISASVRKNIFSSVFANTDFQSNSIFKSIQATFRKRGWPVVSVGYFPSSQLMKLEGDKYVENLFYTLVGTASHFYQHKGIGMNTMFSGTKFYNRQADSNFVYFNSTNLLLTQTLFLKKLTVNGIISAALSQDYALYGADGNLQYRMKEWFEIGGGIKYNYQTVYNIQQVGYTVNARIIVPKLGEIALMADNGFVPGVNRQLVSNKTGRLTYTKTF